MLNGGIRTACAVRAGLMLAALIVLASCDTRHVGQAPMPAPLLIVQVSRPQSLDAHAPADWTVSWTGGSGPYTIEMDMGGGTTEDVPAGTPAESPFTQRFMMTGAGG